MDIDVIKEYLVSLGFEVNQPALNKFNTALRQATEVATSAASGMTKGFVEAGAAVVAALTSITVGTLALMDKTAQADLSYQLFARRMYMSVDAARQMKIATDALGYSIQEIVWGPPELMRRYEELVKIQERMTAQMGGESFESEMEKIREIRFQFTKLQVVGQMFVFQLVKDLSKGLTGTEDGLLGWLQKKIEWLIQNTPRLSQEIANYLVPVMQDMFDVGMDVLGVLKDLTSEFLSFVGLLTGDSKLATGEVTIENIGRALKHVSGFVKDIADGIKYVFDSIEAHPYASKILLGGAAGGSLGGPWGALAGAAAGGLWASFQQNGDVQTSGTGVSGSRSTSMDDLKSAIVQAARAAGVDPAIALAVAQRESSFNPNLTGKKGDAGLFQLMPGTAAHMGVTNPYDPAQNIRGGVGYLAEMHDKYGDWKTALEAYNWGPGKMDKYGRAGGGDRYSGAYADSIMGSAAKGITVNGVTINVQQPNATPAEIHRAVTDGIKKGVDEATVRGIVQGGGIYG